MKRVLIGEGGSSKVYRIWREEIRGFAAEKISRYPLAWEAIWLKRLQEFAVPRFYEVRREGEYWILVMEYLYGKTLEELILENSLNEIQMSDIMIRLLSELMAIRKRYPDIVFCDLKPSNIIVNRKNHIYLIDFDSICKVGVKKICKGTRPYAAPEVSAGCPGNKSDVYSIAQMIWRMRHWKKDFFYYRVIMPCIKRKEDDRQGEFGWLLKALKRYQMTERIRHFLWLFLKKTLFIFAIFAVLSILVWLLEQNHDIIKFTGTERSSPFCSLMIENPKNRSV